MQKEDYLAKKPLTEDTHTTTDKDTESFKICFTRTFYSAIPGNNSEHYNYMWKTSFNFNLVKTQFSFA